MGKYFYSLILLISFSIQQASANCPGCIIDLPAGMSEDTLFLGTLPNGTVGTYYDEDVSFRMPMTTDPVNEMDPDVPAGLNINNITLIGISNLPPGLSWEASATSFDPQSETDGCFKFCGTPLAPGLYEMEVTVEATVFVLTQTVTFPMAILIEPATSVNDGFSLINASGCGEVVASFENNVPSNGDTGFSYAWDFGNGQSSLDENPSSQTYDQPGIYLIEYQAIIDTSGYVLTRVGVNDVSCFDIPTFPDFSNNPDLHVEITDPNGDLIFESETVWNTDPPIEVFPNITLEAGQYQMKVIDEDSGINGADDVCAEITFNQLSNGTISFDDFELELEIFHPVDTILSTDTVFVYEIPEQPSIFNSGADEFCDGETVVLTSSYGENNQWYSGGELIPGETESTLEVAESGDYQVEYTSLEGCKAISEVREIIIYENPEIPEFDNVNNLLSLMDGITFDESYVLQWLLDGVEIEGENSESYCAMEDGIYTLEVTDLETGCISIYTETIDYDENLACTTSTEELEDHISLQIYPNPAINWINVELEVNEPKVLEISIYDVLGKRVNAEILEQEVFGRHIEQISVYGLLSGIYLLELKIGEERIVRKFLKN